MARVNIDRQRKIATAHRLARPHHRRTCDLIMRGAQQLVPRGSHRSGSGKPRPGQPLAASLRTSSRENVNSLVDRIGSTKQYAASEHQGSKAHYINAKGKMLKFEWERGNIIVRARGRRGRQRGRPGPAGNFFYFVRVHHPGNKRPVRYLTTPMHLYGRMRGFRTTSVPVNRTRLP
jgi:hypothetical protein